MGYAAPRLGLLGGSAWEAVRALICRTLDQSADATTVQAALSNRLDAAYRHVAARLPEKLVAEACNTGIEPLVRADVSVPQEVRRGELRALRNPGAGSDDDAR